MSNIVSNKSYRELLERVTIKTKNYSSYVNTAQSILEAASTR